MGEQLTFDEAIAGRDEGMTRVSRKAGHAFAEQAERFVVIYLRQHNEAPGERITNACKEAGIRPHDDRAFGPVYMRLIRQGLIVKCGTCKRLKGHCTAGGNIWRLVC